MHRWSKPRWRILLLVLVGLLVVAGHVEASDGMRGDRCEIAATDYIAEDFYFVCRILTVRGTVDGDLIGIANEVNIERTAVITGDLWIGGGKVFISGTVGDDIHFVGVNIRVQERAHFTNPRTDMMSIALNTEITRGAALPGDLLVYGYQAQIYGKIGGSVDFQGETLTIDGEVEGRVDASVGDIERSNNLPGLPIYDVNFKNPGLRVGEDAVIHSDLAYQSASFVVIPQGVVKGTLRYTQVQSRPDITNAEEPGKVLTQYITGSIRDILTLLIIGVLALTTVPNFVRQPAQHVRRRTITTVGWGLVTFILSFPLAILFILISAVIVLIFFLFTLNTLSIVTGIALLLLNAGLIGGFGFLLFFMGRIIVSYTLGQLFYRYVLHVTEPGDLRRWLSTLVAGAAIFVLLANLPLPALGVTLELVTALAGIGAIMMYLRQLVDTSNLLAQRPAIPVRIPTIQRKAAPATPQYDLANTPGMENLPDGFTGFDEDW